MRLIVLRTGTCGVILHLHRNKLDVAEKGEDGPGAEAPVGGLGGGGEASPRGIRVLLGGFSAARHGTIKCNFTATPQAGKEHFLCLLQGNAFYPLACN